MLKRIKLFRLTQRVKRTEARYLKRPTLRNLTAWSEACGNLYRAKHPPLTIS